MERLLWCNENFFSLDLMEYHELGFYYLVSLPDFSSLPYETEFTRNELDRTTMVFKWGELSEIES